MLHSDALLGAFDFLAPCTSAALAELASGNREEFYRILNPTIPLSRHIFSAPTQYYKTGVVFMAYLNGHQDHFCMVNGQQSARSLLHFSEIFRLADKADAFIDIEVSIERMKRFLNLNGVIQKIAG